MHVLVIRHLDFRRQGQRSEQKLRSSNTERTFIRVRSFSRIRFVVMACRMAAETFGTSSSSMGLRSGCKNVVESAAGAWRNGRRTHSKVVVEVLALLLLRSPKPECFDLLRDSERCDRGHRSAFEPTRPKPEGTHHRDTSRPSLRYQSGSCPR